MQKLTVASVLCLLVHLQGLNCLDRNEILNQYQPLLMDRAANFTAEAAISKSQYNVILVQIENDTLTAISLMTTQIANIKTTIAEAKTASANKTQTTSCLNVQQTAANLLTAAPLNSSCYFMKTYPELLDATNAMAILAAIPNNTISACTTLNPLPSQDELYFRCISDKIMDLDEEVEILRGDWEDSKTSVIQTVVQCLADQSSLLVQKINEINFQVTLCISLGG